MDSATIVIGIDRNETGFVYCIPFPIHTHFTHTDKRKTHNPHSSEYITLWYQYLVESIKGRRDMRKFGSFSLRFAHKNAK